MEAFWLVTLFSLVTCFTDTQRDGAVLAVLDVVEMVQTTLSMRLAGLPRIQSTTDTAQFNYPETVGTEKMVPRNACLLGVPLISAPPWRTPPPSQCSSFISVVAYISLTLRVTRDIIPTTTETKCKTKCFNVTKSVDQKEIFNERPEGFRLLCLAACLPGELRKGPGTVPSKWGHDLSEVGQCCSHPVAAGAQPVQAVYMDHDGHVENVCEGVFALADEQ